MSKVSRGRFSPKGPLGQFAHQLQSRVAPLVAPYMPERYYEIYRAGLGTCTSEIPALDGLPTTTMESGYLPLWLTPPAQSGTPLKLWDVLSQSPRLLIVGAVGSGKTTLLNSLAWRFTGQVEQADVRWLTFKLFGQAVEELMPLRVDAQVLSQHTGTLFGSMVQSVADLGFPNAGEFVRQRLEAGQCIVLLDHLDALDDPNELAQISEMVAAHPKNLWVAASRPAVHLSGLKGFALFELQGIALSDVVGLISRQMRGTNDERSGLFSACERSEGLRRLATFPLMNSAICQFFQKNDLSEPRLATLYTACLEVLLSDWALKRGQPKRYQIKDQLQILAAVAYEMQRTGRLTMARPDLVTLTREELVEARKTYAEDLLETLVEGAGVLRLTAGSDQEYAFVSPTLQHYLAAQWIVLHERALSLLPWANDPAWQEIIILTANLLPDPLPLLYGLEAQGESQPDTWIMLARTIAETSGVEESLHRRVEEHLYELLELGATEYWHNAASAIAGMAHKQLREYFTTLVRVDHDPERRRRGALALGRLRQEWAIPALGAAIADTDPAVREQSAWALGNIPSRQAIHVLPRALRSPFDKVRKAAAGALSKLGQVPELTELVVNELIGALDADREGNVGTPQLAEEALLQVGGLATTQLLAALTSSRVRPTQQSRIARTLGRLGDERALPMLIEAILHGQSDQVEGYIEAVACVGQGAVPMLIGALEGKDVTTSAGLVAALSRIGTPAVGPLIEAIAGNSPEMRNAAVRALEHIGGPAVEPLTHGLLFDNRFEVRRRALEILGHIGEDHVVVALVKALEDKDIGVRMNAVRHLSSLASSAAVPKLVEMLQIEEHVPLRRGIVTSLGAIGDVQAIPTLLAALGEPELLTVSSAALVQFGEKVVEPLVYALHSLDTRAEVRSAAWEILETLGTRARPEEENLFGLASTYAALHRKNLTAEEILALTQNIQWWKHGPEIHLSLASIQALYSARNLKGIGECGSTFDWLGDITEWLRPHFKDILWGFRDVVENISVFHALTRRDAQRDALLSAIDRLEEVRRIAQSAALPFEQTLLNNVLTVWHSTILDVTKELRGRASLLIRLLTPRLPLRGSQQVVDAVFGVFNEGDSAARNLSVAVRVVDAADIGVQVVDGERIELNPLGMGEQREVKVGIAPNMAGQADLVLEAHYDDDERQGVTHSFSCNLQFWNAPSAYTPIERSPYIVGMPVKMSDMFFGRLDIFEWVRENVCGQHEEQPLLLYGERRVGKTSVLYQLLEKPPSPRHICLLFDLQLYGYVDTVNELLFELASAVAIRLQDEGIDVLDPDWNDYSEYPHRAFRAFCDALDRQLDERRILIMLDEFGVLVAKVRDRVLEANIFDYLRGVTQRSNKFTFLFTGAYEVRRMQQDFDSILFNMPKVRKISYLTENEATNLIQEPVKGLLVYHPLVVQKIFDLTAGHPYFIQYICDELVKLCRRQQTNYVNTTDLNLVILGVLQDAAGNIENSIFNYLDYSEKLTLAALAHVTDDVRVYVPLGDVAGLLERRRLTLPRDEIALALQALKERDLVNEMRIGQQLRYSFKMGLTRMWLRQNEILLRLSQEKET